jgi:hypothetical protein
MPRHCAGYYAALSTSDVDYSSESRLPAPFNPLPSLLLEPSIPTTFDHINSQAVEESRYYHQQNRFSEPDMAPAEEPNIAVNTFLNRLVRKPVKKYGRREQKMQFISLGDTDSDPLMTTSDIAHVSTPLDRTGRSSRSHPVVLSSAPHDSPPKKPKRKRKQRTGKAIKERLLEAALLSGVDPVNDLLDTDPRSDRRPLQFQKMTTNYHTPPRRPLIQHQARKVDPFHDARFDGSKPNAIKTKHCAARNPVLRLANNYSLPSVDKQTDSLNVSGDRVPLEFKPFDEMTDLRPLKR